MGRSFLDHMCHALRHAGRTGARTPRRTLHAKYAARIKPWTEECHWFLAGCQVPVQMPLLKIRRDPKDDHLLALAKGAKADLLITGDDDLLVLKKCPAPSLSFAIHES